MSDTTERIAELTAQRDKMRADLEWTDLQWRGLIRAAAKGGQPVAEIAEAAGISKARVYQIRDDRR